MPSLASAEIVIAQRAASRRIGPAEVAPAPAPDPKATALKLTVYDGKLPRPLWCRLGWHSWVVRLRGAFTVYASCAHCGTRRLTQRPAGFKVDWHWVQTGEWSKESKRFIGRKIARKRDSDEFNGRSLTDEQIMRMAYPDRLDDDRAEDRHRELPDELLALPAGVALPADYLPETPVGEDRP